MENCDMCGTKIEDGFSECADCWVSRFHKEEQPVHYDANQTCSFCENPESILTTNTCCTGCSKLKKRKEE